MQSPRELLALPFSPSLLLRRPASPPRTSSRQEGLSGDAPLGLERLELRQGLVRVPRVLREAQVRKRVGEARHGLQLEDERLLFVRLRGRAMEGGESAGAA